MVKKSCKILVELADKEVAPTYSGRTAAKTANIAAFTSMQLDLCL